ncbi:hypothetical protein GCM10022200_09230 [Microbacterium awajiense]|uniref:DUF1648 domain-containing protein n=1 Tax=Microbacterium awajiense TaxID=415214 RepID=A0ABP7ABC5_9MICO
MNAVAVRRFVVVAMVYPAIVVAAAVTAQLILLPSMPSTVAVHWNAAGVADGFAPAWLPPVLTAALGYGVPLLMALTSLSGLRRGDRGPTYRFMGAMAAAVSTLIAMLMTWTYAAQAGTTGHDATVSIWPVLVVSFAAAVVIGVIAWSVQPANRREPAVPAPAQPLDLAAHEQAVWLRTATLRSAGAIAITAISIVLVLVAVGCWFAGAPVEVAWVVTGVAVLVAAIAAMTVAFRVRVDATGLHVVSVAGLPRFAVPIADVASASAVEVTAMGEFGGWGLRKALDGRFGVILRSGPALEVARRDGRRFVVTVDDATTAAGLLETFAQRRAGG